MDHRRTLNPMSRFVAHRKSKATLSIPEPRGPTVLEVFNWPSTMSPYFSPLISHPLRHPCSRSPRLPRKVTRARYSPAAVDSGAGVERRSTRGPVFVLDRRTLQEATKSYELSPDSVTITKGVLPVSSAALPVWPGPLPGSTGALPVSLTTSPVSRGVLPVYSSGFPVSPVAFLGSPALTYTTNKPRLCISTDRVADLNPGTPRRTVRLQQLGSISEARTHSRKFRGSKDLTPVDLSRDGKINRKQNPELKEVAISHAGGSNHKKCADVQRDENAPIDTLTRFSVLKPIAANDGGNDSAESEDDADRAVQLETAEMRSEVVTQSSKVGRDNRDRSRPTINVYLPRVEFATTSSENEGEED